MKTGIITKYIIPIMLFAMLAAGIYGCDDNDSSKGRVTVTTLDADGITVSSALLKGTTEGAKDNMMARGVCYGTKSNPTIEDDKVSVVRGTGEFSSTAYDLEHNTTYYMRAFAMMDTEVIYGEELTFKTLEVSLAGVTLEAPSAITSISALFAGEVVDTGGYPVLECGFCWDITENPDIETGSKYSVPEPGKGPMSYEVQGLKINTTYYVRAFARTTAGVGYSAPRRFTTLNLIPPDMSATAVLDKTTTSFKVSASVTDDHDLEITEKGFCWSLTSQNPTTEDNKQVVAGNPLEYTFANLSPYTIYYIRAYAVSSGGPGYGAVMTVRTYTYGEAAGNLVSITPPTQYAMGWTADIDGPQSNNTFVGNNPNNGPCYVNNMKPYKIGKYEVTNSEFAEFLNLYNSETVKLGVYQGYKLFSSDANIEKSGGTWKAKSGTDNLPMTHVTWCGAQEFCLFYGGSLPFEAQWEFAARGGLYTNSDKQMYSGSNTLDNVAWTDANSGGNLHAVGGKAPNGYGLYDMSGNAGEFCIDWYYYYPAEYAFNPEANNNRTNKIVRGGSFQSTLSSDICNEVRCIHRSTLDNINPNIAGNNPNRTHIKAGFRFCMTTE